MAAGWRRPREIIGAGRGQDLRKTQITQRDFLGMPPPPDRQAREAEPGVPGNERRRKVGWVRMAASQDSAKGDTPNV